MNRLSCLIARLALIGALGAPAFAAEPAHPCGAVAWLDEIRLLQADFDRERGQQATRELLHATLSDLLPAVDARLTAARPGADEARWVVQWADGEARTSRPVAADDDLRELYRGVFGEACALLRQNDPQQAGRRLSSSWRSLWLPFAKAFIARLRDPAAAFGFSDITLSIDSPSVKSANESFSLQWLDQSLGIARLYLPDLARWRARQIDDGLSGLRAQAPIRTLIVDLRGAGGGDLALLESLLARFLPAATLAYTATDRQGRSSEIRVGAASPPSEDRAARLIVLVSRRTRGGAELLAGALQASGRAAVWGERTAGMAGHQRILKLSEQNALIVTQALPRFPGQQSLSAFVVPTREVAAEQALDAALATLAEDGRPPNNPFVRPDERRHPLVGAVLDRRPDDAVALIAGGAELAVEASRERLNALMPRRFQSENDGQTPLIGYPLAIAAAALGLPKVLAALGERAPQTLAQNDSEGRSALAYAARRGDAESTRILLAHGLSPLQPARRSPISNTPLALAAHEQRAAIVGLLMAAIPREQLGHTAVGEAVWTAAMMNDPATVKALLDGGASADYIAPQGGTALIAAVQARRLDLTQLLIDHGATVDDHRYRGLSVLQYAEKNAAGGDPDAKKILELVAQAPRVDRRWQKSAETEAIETLWQMIEKPERLPEQKP